MRTIRLRTKTETFSVFTSRTVNTLRSGIYRTSSNADTEKTLADNLPAQWKDIVFAADPVYKGKDKKDTRTVLQKHLRKYTAKYQFDYFIHKDLGGFLRRELDFYIKNEVMHLDDIEDCGCFQSGRKTSLSVRAVRRCALPIIGMLVQLENFQKKLWVKKKFVVETRIASRSTACRRRFTQKSPQTPPSARVAL